MREIEFRGKRDVGGWVYGYYFLSTLGWHFIIDSSDKKSKSLRPMTYQVIPETVDQYTGLKDKNGVKIFEGDIVQVKTHYYGEEKTRKKLIIFENEIENDSFGEPFTCGYCIHGSNWEVIGNIHDNPELLEKGK